MDKILKSFNKELFKNMQRELRCRTRLINLRRMLHDVEEELSEIEIQLKLLSENFPLMEDGPVKEESARRLRALQLRRDTLKERKSADVDKKIDYEEKCLAVFELSVKTYEGLVAQRKAKLEERN
jgi:predicted  nucleic acid-binding Zn-ribbon protein